MTPGILTTYIKKLGHPLQEIRERSLQLLIAKLQLGWELEDELAGTRELLEALVAWFYMEQPSFQKEALNLLLTTLKSQSGAYVAKQLGIPALINKLKHFRHKLEAGALDIFEDVVDCLAFLNNVDSLENVGVPHLNLKSTTSSESAPSSNSSYYNATNNFQSSRETLVSNDRNQQLKTSESNSVPGISVLLYPWVDLCQSDIKTLCLIENALCVLKSTRRCCRFIRDVFLRDFPAEIFLNRPKIVQKLTLLISGETTGGRIGEASQVLLCIMQALRIRLQQLSSPDLVHQTKKNTAHLVDNTDDLHEELQELTSEPFSPLPPEAMNLAPLQQTPVPMFALETLHVTLTVLARSVVLTDNDGCEPLDRGEVKICVELVEEAVRLLTECVPDEFWRVDHATKTHRDVAHKSCMAMRLLADLINKYRESYFAYVSRRHHYAAWLRLVRCGMTLAHWSRESALPPKALVAPLQAAQIDQTLQMYYPELYDGICMVLKGKRITIDSEYKTKHRELTKIFNSMDEAVKFLKNKNNFHRDKSVLASISHSLPVLDLYKDEEFLKQIGNVLFNNLAEWDLTVEVWTLVRSISLTLMAHESDFIRVKFYAMLLSMVKACLVGEDGDQVDNEKLLNLICDVNVMTEICCHGLCDEIKEVVESASELMCGLVRARRLVSGARWRRLLRVLAPVLPLLHVHAGDTMLGEVICKSLDVEIALCMGVGRAEVVRGLTRLLYVRNPPVQMDAAHSLCHLLDDSKYLPPKESLRADILISALRRVEKRNFNVEETPSSSGAMQTAALTQILDVLKQDLILDTETEDCEARMNHEPKLEPSLRRGTLQQLATIVQHRDYHDLFVQHDGIAVVVAILRMSLLMEDCLSYPECAISCTSVLNSVCLMHRHALSEVPDLPALLLRTILIFPANESLVSMASQTLVVIAWSGFILPQIDSSRKTVCALPQSVVDRTNLPMQVSTYWSTSPNTVHSPVDWLQSSDEWRRAIRLRWWWAWLPPGAAPTHAAPPPGPLTLRPSSHDLAAALLADPCHSTTMMMMDLQNATAHAQVVNTLAVMEMYSHIQAFSIKIDTRALEWDTIMSRYLSAAPGSRSDVTLLTTLLKYITTYMDNIRDEEDTTKWIKSTFFDNTNTIVALLSRERLYPAQTSQDSIEVTQLHIHIVRVLLRCVLLLDFDSNCEMAKLESLLKILLVCLEKVDLKDFHMLGYLNELMRCIRYITNQQCRFSEETLLSTLHVVTVTLGGSAAGGGRKGGGVRLDALLTLLAVVGALEELKIPVERWSEQWSGGVMSCVASCTSAPRPETRAASLHVVSTLVRHATFMPQLTHALNTDSMCRFAAAIFCDKFESSVVRAAAATLLTNITARVASHTDSLCTQRNARTVKDNIVMKPAHHKVCEPYNGDGLTPSRSVTYVW